ncbi:MAG: N-formylglutamate amidohydrolase [Rhodospirillales bacterium]|nr:N-formylglutamate amidohydrolase [Rhodospirillales bacterium]
MAEGIQNETHDGETASWSTLSPARQTVPLAFASPHSGRDYPAAFLAASHLDAIALRRSEDAFVDEIFETAVHHGAPLLKAHFPRAYVDPNREPFELDPAMFDGPLPAYVNTTSPRVAAGLGTVARVVTSGEEIYRDKLSFAAVKRIIEEHYFPYHTALKSILDGTVARFGACLLIDCHSMPSVGGPMDSDRGKRRVDFVLGDRFGTSCAPIVIGVAEKELKDLGYSVNRNVPYAGGYTTEHYGQPVNGIHVLQIEINRALYMDENTVTRKKGMEILRQRIGQLIASLAELDYRVLRTA